MKRVNCTGIVIEQVCPCVLENQEHRTVAENSINVVTEPFKSLKSAYLHTALIRKTMRMATLPDTSALSAFPLQADSRYWLQILNYFLTEWIILAVYVPHGSGNAQSERSLESR